MECKRGLGLKNEVINAYELDYLRIKRALTNVEFYIGLIVVIII